ncbi:MAG: alpha/beta hydrolase [Lactobacillaceae bacterium]|jgi:acetyl esterase/lipase|nr:alpha/beta hydrolase [Lactobacillaceae bacterium]
MKVQTDLTYGQDELQKYDTYQPDDDGNGNTIVVVHGGGWWQGDKHKEADLAAILVNNGYSVVVPNYRFADGSTKTNLFPTQRDDVLDLINQLNLDVNHLAIWGGSSGGNVAFETGLELNVPVVSWSGLLALDTFMEENPDVKPVQVKIAADVKSADIDQDGSNKSYYRWLVENLTANGEVSFSDASPYHRVNDNTKPLFMANSMDELVPVQEVGIVQKEFINHHVRIDTLVLPGSRHAEGYLVDAINPSLTFLKDVLK